VTFNCPANALLDCAQDALRADMRILDLERDDDRVRGKTRQTLMNAGEIIQVLITQQQANSVIAEISSKTRWKTALVDFGRNRANVEKLCAQITGLDPPT
jgi:hypothetical protein